MLSNTIRHIGVPGNRQRTTPAVDLHPPADLAAPWRHASHPGFAADLLAYDPDDPNDPYNDPNDPNRHRPGDTWEIGGKPFDPYDPGPWSPGRVRRPDPRTGRHRRGELPDPLPDGPQYDITTGLAYTISEPAVVPTPPRQQRPLDEQLSSPQRRALHTAEHRWTSIDEATEHDSEPSPPRFAAPAMPTDPAPYEFIGIYAPLGPRVVTTAPSDDTTPPVFASTGPPAPREHDGDVSPDYSPRLAEIAWQRFLANSAELHTANFETLSSLGEAHRTRRRLVWMLRWMLTVLALGLVGPPNRPGPAETVERVVDTASATIRAADDVDAASRAERGVVARRPLPRPAQATQTREAGHPSWMDELARVDSAPVAAGGAW